MNDERNRMGGERREISGYSQPIDHRSSGMTHCNFRERLPDRLSVERCPPGGPAGIGELTEMDHLMHGHRQERLPDRPHLVLKARWHGPGRPIEARLADLLEPCEVLGPETAIGLEHFVEGRVRARVVRRRRALAE